MKAPRTWPTLVCAGWWRDAERTARVHDEVRLLRQGDDSKPRSHGICHQCRDVFIARLPEVKRQAATR